jgi:branched-chain amino acid transport system ATP-binding protein
MNDLVIETRGLTKEFAGFTAVQGVDLRVRRGSIHALIGPNGAGSWLVLPFRAWLRHSRSTG